jgi:ribosomal protein S1
MSVKVTKTKEIVAGDFDWSAYEDGWNGLSLHVNKKVKNNDKHIKVYCHETYAQDLLNQYTNQAAPVSKELKKNTLVKIDGFRKIDENHVSASINGGANNISIDLNKEGKFFNNITLGDTKLTKETFLQLLDDPDVYKKFIDMGLVAKIGTDVEKGSIWDGYVESLVAEMQEQITKKNKAYVAKLVSSNNGGFVVEIAGMVKAFMPGSMAAANKINNYESLVGTEMEVMVESYDSKFGFIVSRKKYLRTIVPIYLKNLEAQLKENKDTMLEVTVTGTTPFGIFCEINEALTGMIHKTLMSDELRERLRQNQVAAEEKLVIYVHKIEREGKSSRIILSDVASADREAVIAKREAEDLQEKSDYVTAKREAAKAHAEAVEDTKVSEEILENTEK